MMANPEFEALMKIADDIHRIADVVAPQETSENNTFALLAIAYNFCAISLEDVLESGGNTFNRSENLRGLIMQWRAMSDSYVKKQEESSKPNAQ